MNQNEVLQILEKRLAIAKPICKNGSCGWVAFYISQYLEESGIKHEIVMFEWGKYKNIHVMVKLENGKFIDKSGINNGLWYKITRMKQNILSREALRLYLGIRSMWNYKFDFDNVPEIRKIIFH